MDKSNSYIIFFGSFKFFVSSSLYCPGAVPLEPEIIHSFISLYDKSFSNVIFTFWLLNPSTKEDSTEENELRIAFEIFSKGKM